MSIKTLNEMCAALHVTRRAVQGYEKHGLVRPTAKNKYGYLLYDETMQARVQTIKRYQDYGFRVKEIGALLAATHAELAAELRIKRAQLIREKNRSEALIEEITQQLKNLE